jgi:hypothetical protein
MPHILKFALFAVVGICIAIFWISCGIIVASLFGFSHYSFAWWLIALAWPVPIGVVLLLAVFSIAIGVRVAHSLR